MKTSRLEPASLAATAKALAEADANHRRHFAAFELGVQRARFEAERARRQFDAVQPENRLVAPAHSNASWPVPAMRLMGVLKLAAKCYQG